LPNVEGFKITSLSKRELIQGLMVAIEQRRVNWPAGKGISAVSELSRGQRTEDGGRWGSEDWEVLTAEMKRYEYSTGPTGQVSYSAPSGYHDDCVMALALAVWGCGKYGAGTGNMMRLVQGDGGRRSVLLA
jgi:hypothetical protein